MLVGMKFFVMKNLASLEWTSGFGHPTTVRTQVQASSLLDMMTHGLLTNVLVGGVSLHFQEVTEGAMPCGAY
jgi:hypothetical protein